MTLRRWEDQGEFCDFFNKGVLIRDDCRVFRGKEASLEVGFEDRVVILRIAWWLASLMRLVFLSDFGDLWSDLDLVRDTRFEGEEVRSMWKVTSLYRSPVVEKGDLWFLQCQLNMMVLAEEIVGAMKKKLSKGKKTREESGIQWENRLTRSTLKKSNYLDSNSKSFAIMPMVNG